MYLGDIFSTLRHSKAATLLLIVQVAFTFAVVVNVYAMVDDYRYQVVRDSGYQDEDSLLGVSIRPYGESERSEESIGKWRNQIERDMTIMRSVPGIKDVAMAHGGIPFQNTFHSNNFDRLRRQSEKITDGVPNTRYSADINTFELLGLELIAGRAFNEGDIRWVDSIAHDGGPNIIITPVMADAIFPDEDPLGFKLRKDLTHMTTVQTELCDKL